MIILGLAGGLSHDASAALVIDGRLISLAEEERFIRHRRAPGCLPIESAAHCLAAAGITMSDVDILATSWIEADPDNVQRDMQDNLFEHLYFASSRRPPLGKGQVSPRARGRFLFYFGFWRSDDHMCRWCRRRRRDDDLARSERGN